MDENGVRTSVHSYPNWNEEMVRIRAAASTNNLQTMKIYVALHSIDMRGLVTYMNMINKQTHIAPVVPLSLSSSLPANFIGMGCWWAPRSSHTAIAVWFVTRTATSTTYILDEWYGFVQIETTTLSAHLKYAAVWMNTDNAKTIGARIPSTKANSNGGNDMRKKGREAAPHAVHPEYTLPSASWMRGNIWTAAHQTPPPPHRIASAESIRQYAERIRLSGAMHE